MPVPIFRIEALGGAWEWLWPQVDDIGTTIVDYIGWEACFGYCWSKPPPTLTRNTGGGKVPTRGVKELI